MSALVNIAKYMYTLFEYETKYQDEVAKIKSMLFQAIAGYTLRKSEKTYHTKRHYIESKKPLRLRLVCVSEVRHVKNDFSVKKKCVQEY